MHIYHRNKLYIFNYYGNHRDTMGDLVSKCAPNELTRNVFKFFLSYLYLILLLGVTLKANCPNWWPIPDPLSHSIGIHKPAWYLHLVIQLYLARIWLSDFSYTWLLHFCTRFDTCTSILYFCYKIILMRLLLSYINMSVLFVSQKVSKAIPHP